ncbi:MAG: hypothetical protein WD844_11970 [Thermoleophilaceae bacterium]
MTVTATLEGRGSMRIPRSFLGFSMEYPDAPFKTGNTIVGLNPVFTGLVENLTASGSGPPVLRLGGGFSDQAWWNPTGRPRPFGVTTDLAPAFTDAIGAFASLTGMPLILGLNFVQRDPSIAAEVAREFMARLPNGSIRAFEIGNEPDIYGRRSIGRDSSGRTVTARPRNYDVDDYMTEVRPFLRELGSLDPRPPLAGPVASCDDEWCPALPAILRRYGRHLSEVTYHWYPLHSCNKRPGSRAYPTIRQLLGPEGISRIQAMRRAVQDAKRHRLGVRITETNSAACGGAFDVSNVFASSLWGADWLFHLAAIGTTGVDFHSSGIIYSPFATAYSNGEWIGAANPLYYGMLLFSRATADRARLLVNTTLGTRLSRPANMRVWATITRRKTARIVVLNKDTRRAARARIEIPRSRRSGDLIRLSAPRINSRRVTLAGQRVMEPTRDGHLVGRERSRRVKPRRGIYRFVVPAGSAAMLTVERVPRRR